MKRLLFQVFLLFFSFALNSANLKVLHITLHEGLANEFEAVATELSLDLTTWYLHKMPQNFFDPHSHGQALYNVGRERANRIWEAHKDFFKQFDVVVTSDTAPLARIFLQNNFQKHLVIWICNRFDYCDKSNLDCDFPDQEFYTLFRQAAKKSNVTIASYTPFEKYYASSKGVKIGSLVIKPCSPSLKALEVSQIPKNIDKTKYLYVTPRRNETVFMDLSTRLTELGIKNYTGTYNGPRDLAGFRGVVHLPYAWSNLALFENLRLGIVYFVPSKTFIKKLIKKPDYWFQDPEFLFGKHKQLHLTEWYCPEVKDVLVYFDSWEDLANKINTIDYEKVKAQSKACGEKNKEIMLGRWKRVFNKVKKT